MLQEVSIRIDGEGQYVRAFELYGRDARDLSQPLEHAGTIVIDSVEDQFDTQGARSLGWRPLKDPYRRWKQQVFPGRPILVQTGAMRAAALDRARALRVTAQRMLYTVHDPKAAYHQRGAGPLPQRKLVNLTAADRRQIDRAFVEWANGLRRGPLRSTTTPG